MVFKSASDAKLGIVWMNKFIDKCLKYKNKHDDPETFQDDINELNEELELLKRKIKEDYENITSELLDNIWSKIIQLNDESVSSQKVAEILIWGEWRIEKKQEFKFGYTNESIYKVYVPNNSDQKIHEYKCIPPIIRWKLNRVEQKGILFYTACAKVEEIEQITSVPSLPIEMTSIEAGLRILDSERGGDEWQRRPNPKRIQSITQFVSIEDNIVANAPILFIKDSKAVKLIEGDLEDELIIDFNEFLVPKTGQLEVFDNIDKSNYIDHVKSVGLNLNEESYNDLRPIWLIDGQHRVRGLSRSIEGAQLNIPIIIFPVSFSLPRAAKIFAEINTLQESLTPLHKLFMQHRFKISSPISTRNFEAWEHSPNTKLNSRANNMSYELLAKLASREDSALYNKIKLLDQNQSSDFFVKADQWVNFSRIWFLHGPYSQLNEWGQNRSEIIYNEVNSYFNAFIETVNHADWPNGKEGWPSSKKNKSILQSATHFKVLIKLFTEVHSRLKPNSTGIFGVKDFKKILIPFKWVDWTEREFKNKYSGGGEKGRTNLYIWMYDALAAKESFPLKAVMSGTIKSVAGKGIMAPPEKSEIKVKGTWPKVDKTMSFTSKRPVNARTKPLWIFYDDKGKDYNDILKITSDTECTIVHDALFDKIKHFKVTVKWSNATDPNATSTRKIIRR